MSSNSDPISQFSVAGSPPSRKHSDVYREQSENSDIVRSNNKHLIYLRNGGGDLLWKAIGKLEVVSLQTEKDFK